MKIDLSTLQPFIDEKYISVRKHPEEDLWIYDYTQNCQFEKKWTPEIIQCRGLILDSEGNVVARPFDKFFNQEENLVSHKGTFVAFDKMDGSMGILYPHAGGTKLSIATRGSFVSDQAIEGTRMLQCYLDNRDVKSFLSREAKTKTYLFEIIAPFNKIVVDYHGKNDLVLLATRDIDTGVVTPAQNNEIFECTKIISDYKIPRDNAEGVVLYYDDGFMEKSKFSEYVRLHRLLTGINARRIWDILRNHQDKELAELTTRVPEEFKTWVENTTKDLKKQYDDIEWICSKIVNAVNHLPDRKAQASIIKKADYPGVCFKILDGSSHEEQIWRLLKPAAEKPYREDL